MNTQTLQRNTPTQPTRCLSAVLLAGSLALAAPVAAESLPKVRMGTNLSSINDWEPSLPTHNLMLGSRRWISFYAQDDGTWDINKLSLFTFRPDGYPERVPIEDETNRPVILRTLIPNTRPGSYIIRWEGTGVIDASLGARFTPRGSNEGEFDIIENGGYAVLVIRQSAEGDPIRNITILPPEITPEQNAANPYTAEFLGYVEHFDTLRFMDWMATNDSKLHRWSDRKPPEFYTWSGGGVPYEHIIDLCNRTKKNAWVCVPHMADDDFIRQMARLFRDKLDPSLKIYLEYSNEVWNWQFQQSHWMLRSKFAADHVMEKLNRNTWEQEPTQFDETGAATDGKGKDHPERIGALFSRTFQIWHEEFGDQKDRVQRVVAVQQGWPDTARRTARYVVQHGGGAEFISPTGYFGPDREIYDLWESAGADLTAEQVMRDVMHNLQTKAAENSRQIREIADEFGLRYIVYEGGQHIQPRNQEEKPYMPALKEAQYSKEMYDAYIELFRQHEVLNCELFCIFSSASRQGTRWGSWGHVEFYGQSPDEMPKFRAVLDCNKK